MLAVALWLLQLVTSAFSDETIRENKHCIYACYVVLDSFGNALLVEFVLGDAAGISKPWTIENTHLDTVDASEFVHLRMVGLTVLL